MNYTANQVEFIKQCIDNGTGNGNKKWKLADLASAINLSEKQLYNIRGKVHSISDKNFALFEAAFFPIGSESDSELKRAFQAARDMDALEDRKFASIASDLNARSYSLSQLWDRVIQTDRDSVSFPILGRHPSQRLGGFDPSEVTFELTDQKFFIAYPETLKKAVKEGLPYDLHPESPDYFSFRPEELFNRIPSFGAVGLSDLDVCQLVERFTEDYAQRVISAFKGPGRHKPYNKKKYGVSKVESQVSTGEHETSGALISLYCTDYFTNWVMSRIYDEVVRSNQNFLKNFENFPYMTINNERAHLPFLTPSIGLNCIVCCSGNKSDKRLIFARTNKTASNFSQHNRLHLPVNEGMNTDDFDERIGRPSIDKLYRRMLDEELGTGLYDRGLYETLSIFIDKNHGEFGIFGFIELDMTVAEVRMARERTAPDQEREFVDDLIDIPANAGSLIQFVLDQPRSIRDFTSYSPHLIDQVIRRGILAKL